MKTERTFMNTRFDLVVRCGHCGKCEAPGEFEVPMPSGPPVSLPVPPKLWDRIPSLNGDVWGCKDCVSAWKSQLAIAESAFRAQKP